jgi:hypothetical protein
MSDFGRCGTGHPRRADAAENDGRRQAAIAEVVVRLDATKGCR